MAIKKYCPKEVEFKAARSSIRAEQGGAKYDDDNDEEKQLIESNKLTLLSPRQHRSFSNFELALPYSSSNFPDDGTHQLDDDTSKGGGKMVAKQVPVAGAASVGTIVDASLSSSNSRLLLQEETSEGFSRNHYKNMLNAFQWRTRNASTPDEINTLIEEYAERCVKENKTADVISSRRATTVEDGSGVDDSIISIPTTTRFMSFSNTTRNNSPIVPTAPRSRLKSWQKFEQEMATTTTTTTKGNGKGQTTGGRQEEKRSLSSGVANIESVKFYPKGYEAAAAYRSFRIKFHRRENLHGSSLYQPTPDDLIWLQHSRANELEQRRRQAPGFLVNLWNGVKDFFSPTSHRDRRPRGLHARDGSPKKGDGAAGGGGGGGGGGAHTKLFFGKSSREITI